MIAEVNEMNDPEASYRRGFHHGAIAALEAAADGGLKYPRLHNLKEWTELDLHHWRMEKTSNRKSQPPAAPKD